MAGQELLEVPDSFGSQNSGLVHQDFGFVPGHTILELFVMNMQLNFKVLFFPKSLACLISDLRDNR